MFFLIVSYINYLRKDVEFSVLYLSYRPPGNITKEIYSMKTRIFRATGAASALALPPVLFLAGFNAIPDQRHVERVFYPKGIQFRTQGLTLHLTSFYLSIGLEPLFPELSEDMPRALPEDFLPPFQGFHFGCMEDFSTQGTSGPEQVVTCRPPLSWTAGTIELLNINVPQRGERWWRNIWIESLWSFKVRKG